MTLNPASACIPGRPSCAEPGCTNGLRMERAQGGAQNEITARAPANAAGGGRRRKE